MVRSYSPSVSSKWRKKYSVLRRFIIRAITYIGKVEKTSKIGFIEA